jgi:hypothetical protein
MQANNRMAPQLQRLQYGGARRCSLRAMRCEVEQFINSFKWRSARAREKRGRGVLDAPAANWHWIIPSRSNHGSIPRAAATAR